MIQSQEERMKVFVRIKPEKPNVIQKESSSKSQFNPNQYDYVLQSTATQEDVFTNVGKDIIDNAIQGHNGCVIAYGQTCSGKTHTLIGNNDGLLPQSLQYLFTKFYDQNVNIKCSVFQIYADKLIDLLDEKKVVKLRGKELEDKIKAKSATNFEEGLAIFTEGLEKRNTSKTDHNDNSSRSHVIFKIDYLKQYQEGGCKITLQSKISFVDLAGSERPSNKKKGQKQLEKETIDINKGIFNLGQVIRSIVDQNQHIPFRDSILTFILKKLLKGESKTSLIATIQLSDKTQTDNTLLFADNFKVIKIKPPKDTKTQQEISFDEQNIQFNNNNIIGQLSQKIDDLHTLLMDIHKKAYELDVQAVIDDYTEMQKSIIETLKSLRFQFQEQNNQKILTNLLQLEQQKNKQLQDIIFQFKQEYGSEKIINVVVQNRQNQKTQFMQIENQQSLDKQINELQENQNHYMYLFKQKQQTQQMQIEQQQQQEQANQYIKILMDQTLQIQQQNLLKKYEENNFKIGIVEDKISIVEKQINQIQEKKNYKREFNLLKLEHDQFTKKYEQLEKDFELFKQNQRVLNQNNQTSLVQDLICQSEQNLVTIEEKNKIIQSNQKLVDQQLLTQYEIQNEIEQQKQNIQNKNSEMKQLKQDIQNRNQQIEQLNEIIQIKNSEMKQLRQDIQNIYDQIKQQKQDIQNKEQKIFNQNQTIQEQEQQIETLKEEAKLLHLRKNLNRIITKLINYIEKAFGGKQRIMTEKQIHLFQDFQEMAKRQTSQSEKAECLLEIVFLDSIDNYIK